MENKLKGIIIGIAILAIFITPISGANWTMFQETVEHTGFIQEAGNFVTNLWTSNVESPIKGSPAIKDKIMYIAGEDGILKAINMETGDKKWEYELKGEVVSSPVINGDNLYIGTKEGHMYSYNIKTEKLSWNYSVSKPIESTATVSGDNIYFGADNGKLYSLNTDGSKN